MRKSEFENAKRVRQEKASDKPFEVVIIGAGVSGLVIAYYLKKAGVKFKIFEKEKELGGTWFTQRFPGVRFDSLHVQTLFSFEPMVCEPMCNGTSFLDYLKKVAVKYGLMEHIHLNEAVSEANWCSKRKVWTVKTITGESYECNFLFNANGYYDPENPHLPKVFEKGADKFKGRLVHSMKLNQEKEDWSGQDVIIIGSGATAATMVPHVAKVAKSVTMIQRSPSFVLQADYGQYPGYETVVSLHKRGITWPWKLYRLFFNTVLHNFVMFMVHVMPDAWFRSMHSWLLRKEAGLSEEDIAKHFQPKYGYGHQRPLVSIGFLEALKSIKLVTATPAGLTERGVLLESGEEIRGDTVVTATGFNLEYFKFKVSIDNERVDMYDKVLRKDMFFEGVPNFVNMVLFGRLDSKNYTCFTPLVEYAAENIVELIQHMRGNRLSVMHIKPLPAHLAPTERYFPMSSSYFMRNKNKCFKADPKEEVSLGGTLNIALGYRYDESEYLFAP